jgi:hypothetical protein
MQEDRPGDIDPEKKEKKGTDTAIDTGIGLVVDDIKDKATLGEVPDQRSDKGADGSCLYRYLGVGRELVGDIEHRPDH